MELLIKPIDVWLFRDGRPFAAGEEHEANTVFPPTPFTLQGTIRMKVLVDKGVDLTEFSRKKQLDPEVGFGDNFGALKLCGPMVARKGQDGKWERLIPMPADLVVFGNKFVYLKPQQLPLKTNLPDNLQLLWAKTDKPVKEAIG